ncbi:MAG: V-type ATP synthase subunit I [Candidatus Aenigmarchaeota archaeon]|nr:V-type ATP synthase subunit I [Candidatus Aenigmarchaeota archaeon]
MFFPEKMFKVTIAAPKSHMEEIIEVLYGLGVIHIKEYTDKEFSIGSPLKDSEKISELLLDLHAIPRAATKTKTIGWPLKKMEKFVKGVKGGIAEVSAEKKALEEKLKNAEKTKWEIDFLSGIGIKNLSVLADYSSLYCMFGTGDTKGLKRLRKLARGLGVSFITEKGFGIFVDKPDREKLQEIVSKSKCTEIKIESKPGGDATYAKRRIEEEIGKLQGDISVLDEKINKISRKYSLILNSIEPVLIERVRKAEAPLKFAASNYAFVIQGWVPEKNTELLKQRMDRITRGVFIKLEETEDAPTKTENPAVIRPFEFFLRLYSLPKYNEIDPSFLIFITFPIFYGIMLGDIGYGLVLFAVSFFLKRKLKLALFDVIMISSVTTILFGFVYGEFFGSGHMLGYELTPWIHRLESVTELILYSVIIGLFHINAGFILGFINARKHGIKKAAMEKLSWITFQIGGLLLLLDSLGVFKFDRTISMGIMAASVIALLKGHGFFGIIEIPSLIGNILSYARLAAIGLASASLAIVVNKMAGPLFYQGGLFIILGVLILLLGHTVNLALGIMDAFLQSLRLHYVEMFTKFYEGAGKEYKPFGKPFSFKKEKRLQKRK